MDKQTNTPRPGENAVVRRPNPTIAMNPKVGTLTPVGRRLFASLLYFSQQDGPREKYIRPLELVAGYADFTWASNAQLKKMLAKVQAVQVEWNTEDKTNDKWTVASMIGHITLVISKENPDDKWIEWSLPQPVRDELLGPVVYTKILLNVIGRMRAGASIGLYDICAQYKTSPGRKTMRKPWEWWRPRLTGNPDKEKKKSEYSQEYKYFKRDVLTPAINEINELDIADLRVELIEHKRGNQVVDIQFEVTPIEKPKAFLVENPVADKDLLNAMLNVGVAEPLARQHLKNYDHALIRETVVLLKKRAASPTREKLESPGAYFTKALQGGYATAKQPQLFAQAVTESTTPAPKTDSVPVAERKMAARLEAAKAAYNALGDAERAALFEEFKRQDRLPVPTRERARKYGLGPGLVMRAFCEYYANKLGLPEDKAAA